MTRLLMGGRVELHGGKHQSRFVMKVHVEGTAWLPPADPSLHNEFTYLRKYGIKKRVSCMNPTSKALSAILLVLPPCLSYFFSCGFIWSYHYSLAKHIFSDLLSLTHPELKNDEGSEMLKTLSIPCVL